MSLEVMPMVFHSKIFILTGLLQNLIDIDGSAIIFHTVYLNFLFKWFPPTDKGKTEF